MQARNEKCVRVCACVRVCVCVCACLRARTHMCVRACVHVCVCVCMRMCTCACMRANSKTLLLKDSSVRSIWTYLTAGPCYILQSTEREREREGQLPVLGPCVLSVQVCAFDIKGTTKWCCFCRCQMRGTTPLWLFPWVGGWVGCGEVARIVVL